MNCYGSLAGWYDSLTEDVPYEQFADLYEAEFARCGGEFRLLLDLCCGTGTLACEMTRQGYELIGVDASEEMLMEAREKAAGLPVPPLYLCQSAADLDLYGTVDAAYCSLDGINYIPPEELETVFERLRLFIRPGGLFLFDLRTPDFLRSLDGGTFVDESEDLFCLWRADFDREENCLIYGMDLFSRVGELWRRDSEEHVEYAHEPEAVGRLLTAHGFGEPRRLSPGEQAESGRVFLSAQRL